MSNYIQFKTEDGDTFLVEVDGPLAEDQSEIKDTEQPGPVDASIVDKVKEVFTGEIPTAKISFEDALNVVKSNAGAFIRKIKELSDRPDEVHMSFGLKATGELGGTFAVASAGVEASYTVTLTWKNEQKNGEQVPGVYVPSWKMSC